MRIPAVVVLAILCLLVGACSGDDDDSSATAIPPTIPATLLPTATPAPVSPAITTANAANLQAVAKATVDAPQGIDWRDDSSALLIYNSGSVNELEAAPNAELSPIVPSVPDGEKVAAVTGAGDGWYLTLQGNEAVNLRRLSSIEIVTTIEPGQPVPTARVSPDGSVLVLQRVDKIAADLYSLPDGKQVKELTGFETAAPVYSVRFSPDGKSLVWVARATVQLMDIAGGTLGPKLEHEDFVADLALLRNADGATLVTIEGKTMHLWDPDNGTEREQVPLADIGESVAASPDRTVLAVGTLSGLQLMNTASLESIATMPGDIRQIAFSPDGRSLATMDSEGEVAIWQVPS